MRLGSRLPPETARKLLFRPGVDAAKDRAGLKGASGVGRGLAEFIGRFFHRIPDLVKASSAKNGFHSVGKSIIKTSRMTAEFEVEIRHAGHRTKLSRNVLMTGRVQGHNSRTRFHSALAIGLDASTTIFWTSSGV
jgi:hypothetical protein